MSADFLSDQQRSSARDTVSGTVDSVIFHNEENGYTVCEIEDENGDPIVLVGIIPYVSEGDHITAYGNWTNHQVYGRQFKIEYYEKRLPQEENDILRYLSSGAVKGIGPKTAQKIVDKFGADSFDIIENHPDWLSEINGITPKKAANISENFRAIAGARSVMMFCRNYFTPATSMRIYKHWGTGAVERIKSNPYRLCTSFHGISFKRADQIAEAIGISKDDPARIAAGITYVLKAEAQRNGHTCLTKDILLGYVCELLDLEAEKTDFVLYKMIEKGEIISVPHSNTRRFALPKYYYAEEYISKKLKSINRLCPKIDLADSERLIYRVESTTGIKYAKLQRKAIMTALEEGVMILTGGPGTGKTTVIRGLISIFSSLSMDIALAAPTGRAAKRISESTMEEAKTIHRLLEMEFTDDDEAKFIRNEDNPLDEDVFIIDESSMIDVQLLDALLRAVKPGSRIIFIGDSNQLPSVGAGNVLADLISSEKFETIALNEIFRQSVESMIVTNAHAINEGRYPRTDVKNSDFFFLPRATDEAIAQTISDLCTNRLPKTYGMSVVDKIQVITPSHKGSAGTVNLNSILQSTLNPPSPVKNERKVHDIVYREGDKVMQTRNNYSIEWEKNGSTGLGVFNGDIGTIVEIDTESESLTINYDDRLAVYGFDMLDEIEHAYAITVHKSQGCEYPVVILPIYPCAPMLQTRNLLYTAVTRASKMVILVGQKDVIDTMVDNDRHTTRLTMLADFLGDGKQ